MGFGEEKKEKGNANVGIKVWKKEQINVHKYRLFFLIRLIKLLQIEITMR